MTVQGLVPAALDDLLSAAVRECLGESAREPLRFVYVSGWEMDGTRLTALGFSGPSRTPTVVAKVGRGPGAAVVDGERRNLERLAAAKSGVLARSVPRVLGVVEAPPVRVVLESPVRGGPLALPRHEDGVRVLVDGAVDWLLEFHAALAEGAAEVGAFARSVDSAAQRYLELHEVGRVEGAFVRRVAQRAAAFAGQSVAMPPDHGDFCLANLFSGPSGLEVIDWEQTFAPALPGSDLVHFLASIGQELAESAPRNHAGRSTPWWALSDVRRPPHAWGEPGLVSTFLGPGWLPQVARGALVRLWQGLAVPREAWGVMFTAAWLKYTVERAERMPSGTAAREAGGHGPMAWSLLRFHGAACIDLAELAARESDLEFR